MAGFKITSAGATSAVSLADAKEWLNIVVATDDDLISSLIVQAHNICRELMNLPIQSETAEYYLDWWPRWRAPSVTILLPTWPVITFSEVAYIADGDTTYTVINSANYHTDDVSEPPRIRLNEAYSLPSLSTDRMNPIRITYDAGWASVPAEIKLAIKMLVEEFYRFRGASSDTVRFMVTTSVQDLLAPYSKPGPERTLVVS